MRARIVSADTTSGTSEPAGTIHRFRVHREHPIAASHQRADEQAPIRLGTDDHFLGLVDSPGDQSMEPRHAVDTLTRRADASRSPASSSKTMS
jgi:hypothetical protein